MTAAAGFGPKMSWLAVRADDPEPVMAALGLRDLGEVDVRAGLDLAHFTDDRVVVTAPIGGWVLVAGRWLFGEHPAAGLSAKLSTEVQYFATHRGTLTQRWERAVDGDLSDVFRGTEDDLVDEHDVFAKAAQWSVDPRQLPVATLHIAAVPVN
ncbi:hypothetical protein KZZ52_47935 [Dactylosporangium sp. AC04546]|uniref:hypothetical protein n=1 Tax=Dactylosporangium sp. AC04546 TaxID=2862460 RepID=UPI001EE130CF|nr:hypothetical protein [Dactylosporangium sp. AC04546]WVK81637.1 hypothetical protein KZZ52_47935 [Dactylosporangium sp. AC04546]